MRPNVGLDETYIGRPPRSLAVRAACRDGLRGHGEPGGGIHLGSIMYENCPGSRRETSSSCEGPASPTLGIAALQWFSGVASPTALAVSSLIHCVPFVGATAWERSILVGNARTGYRSHPSGHHGLRRPAAVDMKPEHARDRDRLLRIDGRHALRPPAVFPPRCARSPARPGDLLSSAGSGRPSKSLEHPFHIAHHSPSGGLNSEDEIPCRFSLS